MMNKTPIQRRIKMQTTMEIKFEQITGRKPFTKSDWNTIEIAVDRHLARRINNV
jgi:hypothetical protein